LSYIEVTNAQHLDALNALPGFDTRFIPLHSYLIQALDLMHAHLKSGTPLPLSQVVHTTPRGGTPGSAPPISAATNLPPIKLSPAAVDRIRFSADTLSIPE
jgi:hydroxybutyrate-dimer hydrolase